jgi:hypothetical protein
MKLQNIKTKLIGVIMVLAGMSMVVYSILLYNGSATLWSIYIGMSIAIMGLGMLGFNIGYGF